MLKKKLKKEKRIAFYREGEGVRGYTLYLKRVYDPEEVKNLWFFIS